MRINGFEVPDLLPRGDDGVIATALANRIKLRTRGLHPDTIAEMAGYGKEVLAACFGPEPQPVCLYARREPKRKEGDLPEKYPIDKSRVALRRLLGSGLNGNSETLPAVRTYEDFRNRDGSTPKGRFYRWKMLGAVTGTNTFAVAEAEIWQATFRRNGDALPKFHSWQPYAGVAWLLPVTIQRVTTGGQRRFVPFDDFLARAEADREADLGPVVWLDR